MSHNMLSVGYLLPSPDVRTAILSLFLHHVCSYSDIFSTVVSANSTREPMFSHHIEEYIQDGGSPVVRVASNSSYEAQFSIDEPVDDEFPSDKF
jgi:hypothetical protein